MTNLYVGSPMTLIYSFGLNLDEIEKVVFVEVSDYQKATGDRDLKNNTEVCKNISEALGKKFEFFGFNQAKDLISHINNNDLLDFRIYMKYTSEFKKFRIKPRFLCLAPEISGIHIPNFHKINYWILKLRLELLIKIFLKFRIFKFYSIGNKGRKGVFIKEIPINWDLFFERLESVHNELTHKEPNYFTEISKLDPNRNLLVILPLADHFGGSINFNKKAFLKIKEDLENDSKCQILVKNHPTDSRNYTEIMSEIFPEAAYVATKNSTEHNFPIELLIANFKRVSFSGTFSSIMYTFEGKSLVPANILIPKEKKNWISYTSGSSIKSFKNKVFFI